MAEGKKILIIEDESFLSSILKGRLEREGFVTAQAMDGEEGLRMVKENKPDIILLDLIMPKVSGFEFMETVRIDPELSKIPVVVASNLGQESDIQKAKELGVIDYYVKATTSVDDIIKMVKRALGMSEDAQTQVYAEAQPEAVEMQQPEAEAQPVETVEPEAVPIEEIPPQEPTQDPNQTIQ